MEPGTIKSQITLRSIGMKTPFIDYALNSSHTRLSLSSKPGQKGIGHPIALTEAVSNGSSWQNILGGEGILGYNPIGQGLTAFTDSLFLTASSTYSKTIPSGTYSISLITKPINYNYVDTFIRFSAADTNILVQGITPLNFNGVSNDALVTIPDSLLSNDPGFAPYIKSLERLPSGTIHGGNTIKMGHRNHYFYVYVDGGAAIVLNFFTRNKNFVQADLGPQAGVHYNLSLIKNSQLGTISIAFAPFIQESLVVNVSSPYSTVSTLKTSRPLQAPYGIAYYNGFLYISEQEGNRIVKMDGLGNITDYAGTGAPGSQNGPGNQATFNSPMGLASDSKGNLYVADFGNSLIRKIDSLGNVSTYAGSVPGNQDDIIAYATLTNPLEIAVDPSGNIYFTSDSFLRKIDANHTSITSIQDNRLTNPYNPKPGLPAFPTHAVAVNAQGLVYYSSDNIRNSIFNPGAFFSGFGYPGYNDGPPRTAEFDNIKGLACDAAGNIWVADGNFNIRRVDPSGNVVTVAGNLLNQTPSDGPSLNSALNALNLTFDPQQNLYFTDAGGSIREIANH
jgi:hypothetical protein